MGTIVKYLFRFFEMNKRKKERKKEKELSLSLISKHFIEYIIDRSSIAFDNQNPNEFKSSFFC